MATTAQLLAWLAQSGARDVAGAVIASGKVRCYDPGTLTPQTVYSDSGASSAITQPLTLDAAGRGEIFTLSRVRVIIKDSTDTTTLHDDDPVNATRAAHVLITNDNVNGGAETSLDDYFTNNALTYLEGSAATARTIKTWMQETEIKATDYAAAGDDSTDDTVELQAIIDRALLADRTNSTLAKTATVFIPAGTYKINGALTAAVSSGTKQLIIRGAGPLRTVIKQYGTAVDTLHLNYSSGTSCRTLIEDIGITCSTTSSGAGIRSTNANRGTMRRVQIGLHRTGVDLAAETGWLIDDCEVVSTDGNSAALGITCGNQTKIRSSVFTGSSSLGKGISIDGTDVKVSHCEVSGFLTGIDANSARARITDCDVTTVAAGVGISVDAANVRITTPNVTGVASTDTGIDINAADCAVVGGFTTGLATGVDIDAVARTKLIGVDTASCTVQITESTSATFTQIFGSSNATGLLFGTSSSHTHATASGASPSITPVIGGGLLSANTFSWSTHSGTIAVGATSTTGLVIGHLMSVAIATGDGASFTSAGSAISFNAQYLAVDGTAQGTISGLSSDTWSGTYRWNGTAWRLIIGMDGSAI